MAPSSSYASGIFPAGTPSVEVVVALWVAAALLVLIAVALCYRNRHRLVERRGGQPNNMELPPLRATALTAGSSSSTATTSGPVISQGPVGTSTSLENAGKCILVRHCDHFPLCDKSYILPPVFVSNITDPAEVQPSSGLSIKDKNRFDGMLRNKGGEVAEKAVFDIFVSLIRDRRSSEDFLLLRSLSFDSAGNLKTKALHLEFPTLDPNLHTGGEFDMLIFVKNLGVIIGEVKKTATLQQINKAEFQIANGSKVVKSLMEAITNGVVKNFPVEKMILFPEEATKSPLTLSHHQSHYLYQDLCEEIHPRWEQIIDELRHKRKANPFTFMDFGRLVDVIVGVWSAKSVNKGRKLEFHEDEANVISLSSKIDGMVKQAKITSVNARGTNVSKPPITNVSRCQISEIFRKAAGPTLFYLSPEQRDLFDNISIAIVNGNAGSGKSLCLLFKVMDIHQNNKAAKTLIIVPTPHDYRLKRVLTNNNIDVEMISKFPPPSPTTPQSTPVYIISLDAFFGVPRKDLLAYPLQDYNILIDDAQSYQRKCEGDSSYLDIADFLKQASTYASTSGCILWFLIDAVQGGLHASNDYSVNLFKQTSITGIPIFTLKQVLRNTREIIGVAEEVRSEEIIAKSRLKLEGIIPEFVEGHGITSLNILYHKLQRRTRRNITDLDYTKQFLLERIEEEILRIAGSNHKGTYSDIAILFGLYQLDDYKQPVERMLRKQFKIKAQSVLELERDGDNGGIVLDNVANTMSFESMCVIYVLTNNNYVYNLVTRARVILTVIDLMMESPPLYSANIDLVKWEDDGSRFVKYQ